jgi:drug/metabolite transporter superfamily protein YnfA
MALQPGDPFPSIEAVKNRFTRTAVVAVLGGALVWVWWRRRLVDLWRQPQHAPLSAQWLYTGRVDHASI